jgi:uncharacterized protein YndB with AHSA1/START domain
VTTNLTATGSILVAAPPAAVWRTLVDPELVSQAFFGARVETDWQPGSSITFSGEWQGRRFRDHGEILDAEPGQFLRFTHFSPLSGVPDEPENYHVVTFELKPAEDDTRVTLTQSNAGSDEERMHSEAIWAQVLAAIKQAAEA